MACASSQSRDDWLAARALADLGAQHLHERLVVPRLGDVAPRAAAHRLDRRLDVGPAGHGDERHVRLRGLEIRDEVEAFGARRGVAGVVEVHEHRVHVVRGEVPADVLHRRRNLGVEPRRAQQQPQRGNDVGLVVGDEHGGDVGHARQGIKRRTSPVDPVQRRCVV